MSKKDNKNFNNESNVDNENETVEGVAEEVIDEINTAEVDVENIDIVKLAQSKMEEYKNTLQRVQAEFDNYRKRNAESVKQARADGGNDMIIAVLPILDSVEIALGMISDEATKAGVQLIAKKFAEVLKQQGVEEIDALGSDFDPNVHNAVMQVEDSENSGKVVEVVRKGYKRNGKVIRYAMVKVAN